MRVEDNECKKQILAEDREVLPFFETEAVEKPGARFTCSEYIRFHCINIAEWRVEVAESSDLSTLHHAFWCFLHLSCHISLLRYVLNTLKPCFHGFKCAMSVLYFVGVALIVRHPVEKVDSAGDDESGILDDCTAPAECPFRKTNQSSTHSAWNYSLFFSRCRRQCLTGYADGVKQLYETGV